MGYIVTIFLVVAAPMWLSVTVLDFLVIKRYLKGSMKLSLIMSSIVSIPLSLIVFAIVHTDMSKLHYVIIFCLALIASLTKAMIIKRYLPKCHFFKILLGLTISSLIGVVISELFSIGINFS